MTTYAIYFPALAMVALTFTVLGVMFRRRVAEMKRDRIHPQKVATGSNPPVTAIGRKMGAVSISERHLYPRRVLASVSPLYPYLHISGRLYR